MTSPREVKIKEDWSSVWSRRKRRFAKKMLKIELAFGEEEDAKQSHTRRYRSVDNVTVAADDAKKLCSSRKE